MIGQPVLHSTNMAPVAVTLESDLAALPTQTFQNGTSCFANDSQTLFVWNALSAAGTVPGVSVASPTGGAWIAIGGSSSVGLDINSVVGAGLSLKNIIPAAPLSATVKGYYTPGDSGGGNFYWDPTNVAADDGGFTIRPTLALVGAWVRICEKYIDVRWFGAKGDGVQDDTPFVVTAMAVASTTGRQLVFPMGNYAVTGFTLPANTHLELLRGAALLTSGTINLPNSSCGIRGPLVTNLVAASAAGAFNVQYTGADGVLATPIDVIRVGSDVAGSCTGICLEGLIIDCGGHAFIRGLHLAAADGGGIAYFTCEQFVVNRPYIGVHIKNSVSGGFIEKWGVIGKAGAFVNDGTFLDTGFLLEDGAAGQEENVYRDFFIATQWTYGIRQRAQTSGPVDVTFERFSLGSAAANTTAVAAFALEGSGGKVNVLNPHIEAHGTNENGMVVGSVAVAATDLSITDGYINANSSTKSPLKLVGFDGLNLKGTLYVANGNIPLINNAGGGPKQQGGNYLANHNLASGAFTVPDFDNTTGFIEATAENLKSDQSYIPTKLVAARETVSARATANFVGTALNWCYQSTIATASNTTPIVITSTAPHFLQTGDVVDISGNTAANGEWGVTVISATQYSLNASVANGAVAGGTAVAVASINAKAAAFSWTMPLGGGVPTFNIGDGAFLFINDQNGASTAGSHPHMTGGLFTRGTYWDGAASQNFDASLVPVLDTEAPFAGHWSFRIKSVEKAGLTDLGIWQLPTAGAHVDFTEGAHGTHDIRAAGVGVIRINDNAGTTGGLGFYTHAVAAQQQVTNNTTGVAATQLTDVTTGGLADPVKVNNNFATIVTALQAVGLWKN